MKRRVCLSHGIEISIWKSARTRGEANLVSRGPTSFPKRTTQGRHPIQRADFGILIRDQQTSEDNTPRWKYGGPQKS